MVKKCFGGCLIVFALLICCRLSSVRISSPPSQIKRIEGYASLKIKGEEGTARSKFSFLFDLPDKGVLDISNVLGRTLYQIIINEGKAFLLIPSKKVYCQEEEEEIIYRFLGFRLNLNELISLLSGQWTRSGWDIKEENWSQSWVFEVDSEGRIVKGERGELSFEVKEFFENTSVVHLLVFHHPLNSGRLKILSISFNRPLRNRVFLQEFLKNCKRKTWAEIEKILNEKN